MKTLKLNLLMLAAASCLSGPASAAPVPCADLFGYSCRDEVTHWLHVQPASTLSLQGDDRALTITLPFAFKFYGQTYTQAWISTNGVVGFLTPSTASGYTTLPSTAAPRALIAAYWSDLTALNAEGAYVRAELRGTAPNRQYVIEWYNAGLYGLTARVFVQAILHESGDVLLQYNGIDPASVPERGGRSLIGIQDHTGGTGILYAVNQPVLSDTTAIRFLPPRLDTVGPAIDIRTPANGSSFLQGDLVQADYSCRDPSGVAQCAGTYAVGAAIDTAAVGTKSFAVQAADTFGNLSSLSATYSVRYRFTGFLSPVVPDDVSDTPRNRRLAGSAVPLKFSLNGFRGLDVLDLPASQSKPIDCASGAPLLGSQAITSPGASGISYDALADVYTLVWNTDKAWQDTCRLLRVGLKDGSTQEARFDFRR